MMKPLAISSGGERGDGDRQWKWPGGGGAGG
jgi:hypothetical protein